MSCMVRWIFVSLLVLCSLPGNGQASTILVMGDSLTAAYGMTTKQGWVALLAHRLSGIDSEHHVVNASISGETSSGGLRRIDLLLKEYQPDVLVLALGANDGLRASRPDLIEYNLGKMIEKAKQQGTHVLLVGMRLPPNYGTYYNDAFDAIFPRLSRQNGIPLVPFLLQNIAEHDQLMQQDRFHPTASAQPKILQTVWPFLLNMVLASPTE